MVTPRRCFTLGLLVAATVGTRLSAADYSDWRAGDIATRDVVTPVALDVIDAPATAARRALESTRVAAVFRAYTSVTNTMVVKLAGAFSETRSNFLAAVQKKYHRATLDQSTVQADAFEEFVSAFNRQNKKFPLPLDVAGQWAQGIDTRPFEAELAQQMLLANRRPVMPDTLPAGFEIGDSIRLVTVRSAKEPLTLAQVERRGKNLSQTNLITVSNMRALFRRELAALDPDFSRALANLIHPNCDIDTNLTAAARAQAITPIVVAYHYDAGQTIVQRGQKVDSRVLASLQRLADITPLAAAAATPPPAANPFEPVASPKPMSVAPSPSSDSKWWIWLVPVALVAVVAFIYSKRRRSTNVALMPVQQPALPAQLAPQLVEVLKTAVVQELAAQRQELMQAQNAAASEVVRLMHRLNEMQAPLQDRLSAYERRIQELETELTVRKEENRELLKAKIDLLRQQMEAERVVGNRQTGFN